jgi:hypothetical protein
MERKRISARQKAVNRRNGRLLRALSNHPLFRIRTPEGAQMGTEQKESHAKITIVPKGLVKKFVPTRVWPVQQITTDPFAVPDCLRPELNRTGLTCRYCLLPVFKDVKTLRWHERNECTEVPQANYDQMAWTKAARENGKMPLTLKDLGITQGGAQRRGLLHGSDVPKGTESFEIKVSRVRQAPKSWNAALILDLAKPVFDNKKAWAVNQTNAVALAETVKGGDLELLVGKTITLWVVDVEDPEGNPAIGLSVVEPE